MLNLGKCVQCDRPERIFRNPRTRFVAGFFRGCNVLEARKIWENANMEDIRAEFQEWIAKWR